MLHLRASNYERPQHISQTYLKINYIILNYLKLTVCEFHRTFEHVTVFFHFPQIHTTKWGFMQVSLNETFLDLCQNENILNYDIKIKCVVDLYTLAPSIIVISSLSLFVCQLLFISCTIFTLFFLLRLFCFL
jgi:hypothetical protein